MSFAIIARVLLSWVHFARPHSNSAVQFLHDITDPILNLAKKITPRMGMIDLSPVIAVVGLDLLRSIILYILGAI